MKILIASFKGNDNSAKILLDYTYSNYLQY